MDCEVPESIGCIAGFLWEDMMDIYFFGDSIRFGQGISVDLGGVTKLSERLRKDFPEQDITSINSSINGNTTRMALERMPYDIQSHHVDILIVGFGMNDCNYWESDKGIPRVSPSAFEANLKEIIQRAYHFGAQEVILRTNHPSPRKTRMINTQLTYAESNANYNEIIRKVADENKNIKFVDMEKAFIDYCQRDGVSLDELVLPDQIHLSQKGHEIYLETFYPKLKEYINKLLNSKE